MLKKSDQSQIYPTLIALKSLLLAVLLLNVQAAFTQTADSPQLTLDRIFSSKEFQTARFGGFRWLKNGDSYAKLEPSATVKGAMDLASYNIETNKKDVLIPAEKLIPKGASAPLSIHGYEWSADDKKVLIYTNSKKVWRLNTRGDYWVLDMASRRLTSTARAS